MDGEAGLRASLVPYVREKIKQELTTADIPELNGVTERQITIIESAVLAARIQASGRYPDETFPKGEGLWAEQASWVCDALNYTETTANLKIKSPYGMWFDTPPQSPLPSLKPRYRTIKTRNKLKPKAGQCCI